MKKITILLIIITAIIGNTFSQINYEKFSIIGGIKSYSDIFINGDSLSISSFEIGIGLRGGREFNSKLVTTSFFGYFKGTNEIFANWAYITPYLTTEINTAYSNNRDQYIKLKNENSPLILNLGGSAGAGFNLFYIIPIGVCGSAGFSSDLKDVFLSYSYGICAYNLALNFGGRTNLTKNNSSFYKSLNSIELKYTYNLFKLN